MPSYVIALQQILDHTSPQSPDCQALSDAIDELRKLSVELQESQKVSSNISTMLGAFNELAGFPGFVSSAFFSLPPMTVKY